MLRTQTTTASQRWLPITAHHPYPILAFSHSFQPLIIPQCQTSPMQCPAWSGLKILLLWPRFFDERCQSLARAHRELLMVYSGLSSIHPTHVRFHQRVAKWGKEVWFMARLNNSPVEQCIYGRCNGNHEHQSRVLLQLDPYYLQLYPSILYSYIPLILSNHAALNLICNVWSFIYSKAIWASVIDATIADDIEIKR